MGIPVMPGPNYLNACPLCFGVDHTPDAVICSLSGILIGEAWEPGFLNPPNRMIILNHYEYCSYFGFYTEKGQNMTCRWHADIGSLRVMVGIAIPVFTGAGDPCDTYFTNSATLPHLIYYMGHAQIICARSFSVISESQHIAGLLGIQPDEHTKFDFWPISESRMGIRMARYMKGANLLMEIDRDAL